MKMTTSKGSSSGCDLKAKGEMKTVKQIATSGKKK